MACGTLLASSAEVVRTLQAAVKGKARYSKLATRAARFLRTYRALDRAGRYTAKPAGGVDDGLCQTLADGLALSWLSMQSELS